MPASLVQRLAEELRTGRLPGPAAQRQMAPELSYGRHFSPPPEDARRAAVMVLLYPAAASPSPVRGNGTAVCLPLIVRPDYLEHHAGQVALPGGIIESGESSWEAAVRELDEELGVPSCEVEPLGQLSPLYIFGSNHYVETWVARARGRPQLVASADEVARVLEMPIVHLLDPAVRETETRTARGVQFLAPFYGWDGEHIWGATAMILAELAAVVARIRPTEQASAGYA